MSPFLLRMCLLCCCLVTVLRGPDGASAASRPLVYAALGASETVGVGADHPATESWVADLARKLPHGSRLINLGKSGALLSYGVQQEMPRAIASHPDVITVWMVVNDINGRVAPATYRAQLDTLLGTLQRRTHAAIYVGNVPDLTQMPFYRSFDPQQLMPIIKTYNGIIDAVARVHHAAVVDIYSESKHMASKHPEYISGDGFHPSTAGYADLANFWWNVIRRHPPIAH